MKKVWKMKCGDNCGYWWQDEDEDYPSCHFDSDSPWPAPCEYDGEEDDTDINDDFGFDPFEGCYTYDC